MTETNGRATIREVIELLERLEDKIDRKLSDHELRLRGAERWRYALPPTLLLAATSLVIAALR